MDRTVMISTVPAVLDKLVELAGSALSPVQVLDGRPIRDIDREAVSIGYTEDPNEPAVENTRDRAQASTSPDQERFEVKCAAWVWLGAEVSAKAVRDRAYELVDTFAAAIAADQTLGLQGTVMRAMLATVALEQDQTDKGATAVLRFVVSVHAFTR